MREFYPYWAANMIIATYEYEGGGDPQAGLDALKQTQAGAQTALEGGDVQEDTQEESSEEDQEDSQECSRKQ